MPKPQPTTSERQHESGTFSLVNIVIIGKHCDQFQVVIMMMMMRRWWWMIKLMVHLAAKVVLIQSV